MNKIPYELIALLSDGKFHSGEMIGDFFGVSRSAVWKQLKKVTDLGIEIETVKGKGYRVIRPFKLLDDASIRTSLNDLLPHASLSIFPVTDSTNDYFNRKIFNKENVKKGDLILAEQQTAGKGRRGRVWQSSFAKNIMMSLVWSFDQGLNKLDGLSLVVGLALAESLKAMSVPNVALKWPNDVMVNDKKVAGILLEMNGDPTAECLVIIGVGLNVNMRSADVSGIEQPWISISEALGSDVDRSSVVRIFIDSLIRFLRIFEVDGFDVFRRQWGDYDWLKNKPVVMKLGESRIFGKARGVDGSGGLFIEEAGVVSTYTSGEVSIRRTS